MLHLVIEDKRIYKFLSIARSEAEWHSFIREKSGLSKKDFAESLGLSMTMGFQIATGRIRPSREVMERLSSVYNVNLHWFITGEGSPGYNPDTVEIELLEQEAAAGRGREAMEYLEKHSFKVPAAWCPPTARNGFRLCMSPGTAWRTKKSTTGTLLFSTPD